MKLLYITYINFNKDDSGSSIRPIKMYNAFLKLGVDVLLIHGDRTKEGKVIRKEQVKMVLKWLNNNRPDLCYIESPTKPLFFLYDVILLKKLNKMKIPIGYFFRDMHYKFEDEFPNSKKGILNSISFLIKKKLTLISEKLIGKYCTIVYFPAPTFASYFDYKIKEILPPAGEDYHFSDMTKPLGKACIYVGGISERYGINLLIDSFIFLNKTKSIYKLILVCRKDEFEALNVPVTNYPWLEVHHVSGEKLTSLYKKADIALLPLKNTRYNNATIAVKLYEYMSFGLPIVAVECTEMASIIEKYKIGIITHFSVDSFSEGIKTLFIDEEKYRTLRNNISTSLVSENLWIHRAEKVISDLNYIKCDRYNSVEKHI